MNRQILKGVGRWFSAVVVCAASLVAAFVVLEFTVVLLPRTGIRWADAMDIHLPVGIFVSLLSLVAVAAAFAVWNIPSAFAVGYALRMPALSRLRWGFTACLLLTAVFRWYAPSAASTFKPHIFILVAWAVLVGGVVLSFRRAHGSKTHSFANAAALVLLTLPYWIALAISPPQPLTARKLWSVTLQKDTWQAINTGSEFSATRKAIFAGDRILVVFDAGPAGYVGSQPMSTYRLLSLDVKTGAVRSSKAFVGRWGGVPDLYSSRDGYGILNDESITVLNPDLSPALPKLTLGHGRVGHISPDGGTLAWETFPGTTLLDSHTLKPVGKHLHESDPTSVSSRAVVNNSSWYGEYPKESSFVTLTDEHGQRLLFHSQDGCGWRPQFLTDDKVLFAGCSKIRVLGIQGELLKEAPAYEGQGTFAGVSQNGKRFALQHSDERGDPSALLYEHFIIYDADSLAPISIVRMSDLPERQSWSAFSPDGSRFVVGSPDNLTLYRLP